ncbi:HypC/HybG/HupF family hydrogenase formation chaperone [bacterium]|nr:HypC/HybG/HupF family hydrogenase formation chaperone [bacterium]
MCLGIPAKIVKITGSVAEVDLGGVRRKASLDLLEEAKVGDYVLLHAGFAIQKLSEKDARQTLAIFAEIGL